MQKVCTSCHVAKPLTAYYRQTKGKYGRRPVCTACYLAQKRRRWDARRQQPAEDAMIATPTKVCRGDCRRRLPMKAFGSNGHGGLESRCRRCRVATVQTGRQTDRQRGVKRCDECGHKLPFDRFARIPNTPKFADTCMACAKYLNPSLSPVEEGEAVQAYGLRQAQQWAVAWDIVARERGVTMAEYMALRGLERQEFEEAWTEQMRRLSALITEARAA